MIHNDSIPEQAANGSRSYLAGILRNSESNAPVQEAFECARAYVRWDESKFNPFSRALVERYGQVNDEDRSVLNHLLSNPDSSESPWNRSVGTG